MFIHVHALRVVISPGQHASRDERFSDWQLRNPVRPPGHFDRQACMRHYSIWPTIHSSTVRDSNWTCETSLQRLAVHCTMFYEHSDSSTGRRATRRCACKVDRWRQSRFDHVPLFRHIYDTLYMLLNYDYIVPDPLSPYVGRKFCRRMKAYPVKLCIL